MSLTAYRESQELMYGNPSFDAIIMAAMWKADDINLEKLKDAFPETLAELQARYNAPGGCLNERELSWLTRVLTEEEAESEEDCEART